MRFGNMGERGLLSFLAQAPPDAVIIVAFRIIAALLLLYGFSTLNWSLRIN
jgi:hypothetical protein